MKDDGNNITQEIRMLINEKLSDYYEGYLDETITEHQREIFLALIEAFENIAIFAGGLRTKDNERRIDRELGNLKY